MATGTGKTYTAFPIIWRLWKAGRKKRILFLADRNVLVVESDFHHLRRLPNRVAATKLPVGSECDCETEQVKALPRLTPTIGRPLR